MASAEGNYTIKDFHFADGETLPELRIHYRTLRKPVSSSGCIQNAVLLLHGTSVTGDAFLAEGFRSAMFGPGQALDVSKYYLILPDFIGLGGSGKPSDGLHSQFPHYGYHDMIEAQTQLVTQGLGVNHLAVVLGTSMGGMHAWLWAEKYPEMMDTVIPIACLQRFAYSPIRRLSAWPGLGCTTDFQDGFSPKTKAAQKWGTSVLAPAKRRGRERSDRDSAG